jgi:hypothetical protein
MAGYDHILRNSSFYHSHSEFERTQLILQNKKNFNSVMYIGKNIIDQNALLLADVSIK